ncbi:MAG TPA: YciI-like protein [Anaeromyxobacteraceae bacterium]|nr:YciI-like protein [Anaeromyxobacteraceae bacterium]
MHHFLWYELVPDYLSRRGEFRDEHLTLAWQAVERGELVLAGAVGDPPDTALLLFQGDSPGAAERFARADPYVRNGLVARWRVRPWTTVVGAAAATPVRP